MGRLSCLESTCIGLDIAFILFLRVLALARLARSLSTKAAAELHKNDLAAIQRRGRWRSWGSMRRYEKGPRLAEVLSRLEPHILAHGLQCAKLLGDVAAGRRRPLPAP